MSMLLCEQYLRNMRLLQIHAARQIRPMWTLDPGMDNLLTVLSASVMWCSSGSEIGRMSSQRMRATRLHTPGGSATSHWASMCCGRRAKS